MSHGSEVLVWQKLMLLCSMRFKEKYRKKKFFFESVKFNIRFYIKNKRLKKRLKVASHDKGVESVKNNTV